MNPDQTAPKSDLGPYCLQNRTPKYVSRTESRSQYNVAGKGLRIMLSKLVGEKSTHFIKKQGALSPAWICFQWKKVIVNI